MPINPDNNSCIQLPQHKFSLTTNRYHSPPIHSPLFKLGHPVWYGSGEIIVFRGVILYFNSSNGTIETPTDFEYKWTQLIKVKKKEIIYFAIVILTFSDLVSIYSDAQIFVEENKIVKSPKLGSIKRRHNSRERVEVYVCA